MKAIGSIPRWSRTSIWASLQGMSIRLMIGVPQNSPLLHSLIDHRCLCWCTMKLPKLYPLATPRLTKPVSTVFSNLQLTGNSPIMAVLHSADWLSTTYHPHVNSGLIHRQARSVYITKRNNFTTTLTTCQSITYTLQKIYIRS